MIRTKSRREQRSGEGVNSSYCETPKGVKLRRKNAKRKSQRDKGCEDQSWKTFNVFYWKYLLIWDIFWCIAMHFLYSKRHWEKSKGVNDSFWIINSELKVSFCRKEGDKRWMKDAREFGRSPLRQWEVSLRKGGSELEDILFPWFRVVFLFKFW